MDFDDFFDEQYDYEIEGQDIHSVDSEYNSSKISDESENGLHPLNFHDPLSAFLFLSDDVQDELENTEKRKRECLACEHKFTGQITDQCPVCGFTETVQMKENGQELP